MGISFINTFIIVGLGVSAFGEVAIDSCHDRYKDSRVSVLTGCTVLTADAGWYQFGRVWMSCSPVRVCHHGLKGCIGGDGKFFFA